VSKQAALKSALVAKSEAKGHTAVKPPPPKKNNGNTSKRGVVGEGHPFVKVDVDQLALLVKIGCTMDEIAEVLKVAKDTIERNYMPVVVAARKERNVAIRRKQYQLAMDGDRTMLVWLGKQWLGQTDQLQLGNNPDNPLTPGGSVPVIEIIFVESDGDGHPKTIEGIVEPKKLTGGSNASK